MRLVPFAALAVSLAGLALAAAPGAGLAQGPPSPTAPPPPAVQLGSTDRPTLVLSATGHVSTTPDMASLNVAVETAGPSAAAAMRDNAAQTSRMLAALKGAGVASADLQTADLALSPQYVYQSGKPPRLTGYQARDRIAVAVHDLSRLGPVVDAAVGAGATDVSDVTLGLADPQPAQSAAGAVAIHALQAEADAYARAAGYRTARLIDLEMGAEASAPVRPIPVAMARMAAVSAPTPVETGQTRVEAVAGGVFELGR